MHYKLRGADFYTKIRPYTHTFLRRMSELYEMHIISYGERQYAHKIAEILDPDKRYFGHSKFLLFFGRIFGGGGKCLAI